MQVLRIREIFNDGKPSLKVSMGTFVTVTSRLINLFTVPVRVTVVNNNLAELVVIPTAVHRKVVISFAILAYL